MAEEQVEFKPAEITIIYADGKIKWNVVAQEEQTCTLVIEKEGQDTESLSVQSNGEKVYDAPFTATLNCVGVKTASKVGKTLSV